MEEWKDIPGYEGRYQASTFGRIKSLRKEVFFGDNRGSYFREEQIISQSVKSTGYYVCNLYKDNIRTHVKVHRIIAKTLLPDYTEKLFVDHVDGNPKNNKIGNIRMCTVGQNTCNQKVRKGKLTSGYKGVSFSKITNKWLMQIALNGKTQVSKLYLSEIAAAIAYDKYALELHGAFARTNKMLGLL